MRMSKLAYFAEFLVFPPLMLIFTILAFDRAVPPRPASWALGLSRRDRSPGR